MLILGITGMAVLLCVAHLYGCITAGKRSDREYRRLWEEYIAVHQKEEEKENGSFTKLTDDDWVFCDRDTYWNYLEKNVLKRKGETK